MGEPGRWASARDRLLPKAVSASDGPWSWWPHWKRVSTAQAVGVSIACALLFLFIWTDDDGYLLFLDTGNLIVHEGGHFLFAWLGETISLWGGTILQLAVPLAVVAYAAKQEEPAGAALALVWFFENFLNVARYMADARTQALPLVGGNIHDWGAILGGLGLLRYDVILAAWLRRLGWIGMIASWAWLLWRVWEDRQPEATRSRSHL